MVLHRADGTERNRKDSLRLCDEPAGGAAFGAVAAAEINMSWPINTVKTFVRRLGDLSPGCKEAIRLESAALDRKLTLLERFGLRFHLILCKWCRSYGRQITFLRSAAGRHARDDPYSPRQVLSSEARERIKRMLRAGRE